MFFSPATRGQDSSNLTINEPFIARMFANSCAQLLCQRGEIVIECSLIGYWLLYLKRLSTSLLVVS